MKVSGNIDRLSPELIEGWILDLDQPEARFELEFFCGQKLIGRCVAGSYRKDLADAKQGDGQCAFSFEVSPPLSEKELAQLQITAGGSTIVYPGVLSLSARPRGRVENVDKYVVDGWVYLPESPSTHLTVTILKKGTPIGTAVADRYRADLQTNGIGGGDHAFAYAFSPALSEDEIDQISAVVDAFTLKRLAKRYWHAAATPLVRKALSAIPPVITEARGGGDGQRPLFIVGAARSGTSAITHAIATATQYVGFQEGHFLELLEPLLETTCKFYESKSSERGESGTMIHYIPQDTAAELFFEVWRRVTARIFSGPYWMDKTPNPSMIRLAPTFLKIWPNARFIFMKRRGIDNLLSRKRKFQDTVSFEAHCQEWAESMQLWENVRPSLGRCWLEIDQYDMLQRPMDVAQSVGALLELTPQELEVLGKTLRDEHPQRTNDDYSAIPRLSDTGWTREQIETFDRICGGVMNRSGYGLENYFADKRHNAVHAAPKPDPADLIHRCKAALEASRWDEASEIASTLRAEYPDCVEGYRSGVLALHGLRKNEEAAKVLSEASRRYSEQPWHPILSIWNQVNLRKLQEARNAWEKFRKAFPTHPDGYKMGIEILRELGLYQEGGTLAEEAMQRIPPDIWIHKRAVDLARLRADWDAAARYAGLIKQRFPNDVTGYLVEVAVLRREDRHEEAGAALLEIRQRFAEREGALAEVASAAMLLGDFHTADECWREAALRLPSDPEESLATLATRFVSLGGTVWGCEFGFVQRFMGAEPLDLLRWAAISLPELIDALEHRFEGVGSREQTEIAVSVDGKGEYHIRDRRFGIDMHTCEFKSDEPPERLLLQRCRSMTFLRRKLLEDLESGQRIFVYRPTPTGTVEVSDLNKLHAALNRYADNALLYVRLADEANPPGSVRVAGDRLYIGHVSWFVQGRIQDTPPDMEAWQRVCTETFRLWRAQGPQEAAASAATPMLEAERASP